MQEGGQLVEEAPRSWRLWVREYVYGARIGVMVVPTVNLLCPEQTHGGDVGGTRGQLVEKRFLPLGGHQSE